MTTTEVADKRSTASKLWCIKILSGDAYLFKGGKKVEHFRNIVGAEEITVPVKSKSGSTLSSTSVTKLKVHYTNLFFIKPNGMSCQMQNAKWNNIPPRSFALSLGTTI